MIRIKHRKNGQVITVSKEAFDANDLYKKSYRFLENVPEPKQVEIKVEPKKRNARKSK